MQIDEEILLHYALGILDKAQTKKVQRKIATSPALQSELASIQNALESVSLAEKPVQPSPHLRALILNATLDKTRFDGFIERFTALFDLDEETSHNLLKQIDNAAHANWQSTPFPGVKILKFPGGQQVSTATCGLVQVQPGKIFPAHQHQAKESNLILQGEARDDQRKAYKPGDIFDFTAGSRHSFRCISDDPFIFAVVLYKDNKWLWGKTLMDYFSIHR